MAAEGTVPLDGSRRGASTASRPAMAVFTGKASSKASSTMSCQLTSRWTSFSMSRTTTSASRARASPEPLLLLMLISIMMLATTAGEPAPAPLLPPSTAEGTTLADLLAVIPTHEGRMPMLHGIRSWSKDISSIIVTNASDHKTSLLRSTWGKLFNELYLGGLDDGQFQYRGHFAHPGHIRYALAPFLAHKHYTSKKGQRSYQWMLFGDDDTLWYVPNVLKLVRRFDASLPLAITDNVWWGNVHPHPHAPRCLACLLPEQSASSAFAPGSAPGPPRSGLCGDSDGAACPDPPRSCGACTAQQAWQPLRARKPRASSGSRAPPGSEQPSEPVAVAHGGGGVLFSRGLLERVSLSRMADCVKASPGVVESDKLLSTCLFQQGVAFTDPGLWLASGTPAHAYFDSRLPTAMGHRMVKWLAEQKCGPACVWSIENKVSVHVAARNSSPEQAELEMHRIVSSWRTCQDLVQQNETLRAWAAWANNVSEFNRGVPPPTPAPTMTSRPLS